MKKTLFWISIFLTLFLFTSVTTFADVLPTISEPSLNVDLANLKELLFRVTLPALLLTILLELPIFYFLGLKSRKSIITVIVMNVITLTLFHYLYYVTESLNYSYLARYLTEEDNFKFKLIAEIVIIIIEAVTFKLVLKKLTWKRSFLTSLLANLVSMFIGTIIFILFLNLIIPDEEGTNLKWKVIKHFSNYLQLP